MFKKFAIFLWSSVAFVLLISFAIYRVKMNGDGAEYFAISANLMSHGDVSMHSDTWEWVENVMSFDSASLKIFKELPEVLDTRGSAPFFGFARASDGSIYAIHFWLYSLLMTPVVYLASAFGLNPAVGFAIGNLCIVACVAWYLRRVFPLTYIYGLGVFIVCGTIFYLRWTGPEVYTAATVLIATIAMVRSDFGVAVLLAGIGSTQNPSVSVIIPIAITLMLLRPRSLEFGAIVIFESSTLRNGVYIIIGLLLTILPFVFFYSEFGTSSLTGRYFTSSDLVSYSRFWSLFFDLNQGMFIALPGPVFGLIVVYFALKGEDRRQFILWCLIGVVCVVGIMVPTLTAINWNSGGSMVNRYAYWGCAPLIAILLVGVAICEKPRTILVIVISLQGAAILANGAGWRQSSYLNHTALATAVLDYIPSVYNPVPEIMIERTNRREMASDDTKGVVWRKDGRLVKVLQRIDLDSDFTGTCTSGHRLIGGKRAIVERGWEYIHPPFSCREVQLPVKLTFGLNGSSEFLGTGWYNAEKSGTWSSSNVSNLFIRASIPIKRIRFVGHYLLPERKSLLTINGRSVKNADLSRGLFILDEASRNISISIQHDWAVSPKMLGMSEDQRMLAFFLSEVYLYPM
ncbi:MAG: hypothetical protein ACXW3B_00540 [Telluria sp.]